MSQERAYVLGTGTDEHERLGLQHRLWANAANDAWMRARIGPGQTVLDLGCGPGWATFDLAQLVTSHGRVLSTDLSERFVDFVRGETERRGLAHVDAFVADATRNLGEALASRPRLDAVWARWVFCFTPSPESVVAALAPRMNAGARIVVHDYFNYTAMTAAPRSEFHDRAVAATARSWRDAGGDPDVAGRLPAVFMRHGIEVEHIQVHQRAARSGDPMLAWPDTWWRTWAPKLVESGYLTRADCDGLLALMDEIGRDRTRFILPPPVTEIIAVKR